MRYAEQILQASVHGLFDRMPHLVGFHVGEDLSLEAIEFDRCPGFTPTAELYEEIAEALAEAIDEQADAVELVRNRTFARTLQ